MYRLSVEVVDELAFSAAAAPLDVTIEVVRPSPPTPTPAPIPTPVVETAPGPTRLLLPLLLALAAGGLLWGVRRARRGPAAPPAPSVAPPPPPPPEGHVAVLEWAAPGEAGGETIELLADNVTLGREPGTVDIVLDDPGVSRLHARIRRDATGVYWL